MPTEFSQMTPGQLFSYAEQAMRDGRLRDAKNALDEIGLRFDDAYSRLEARVLAGGQKEVWS